MLATRTGSTLTFVQSDHLGSSTTLTNSSGQVIARDRYAAFGERRRYSNIEPTDQLYTGQRFMFQTGLYHYSAGRSAGRFYDPVLARFVQPDHLVPEPRNPQAHNRFSYTLNNPLRYTDPNGQCGPLTPLCLFLIFGGLTLAVQDEMHTPGEPAPSEDAIRSQQIGGAMIVGGAGLQTIIGAAGMAGPASQRALQQVQQAQQAAGVAANSVWNLRPFDRGVAIENTLGRSPFLVQNFPVIDRFANGVATSIKSIDLRAPSYQNLATLERTVTGQIDTLATWQGQLNPWGGVQILPNQITGRVLELAIPPGATAAQIRILQQLQQYATTVGVRLDIIVIP